MQNRFKMTRHNVIFTIYFGIYIERIKITNIPPATMDWYIFLRLSERLIPLRIMRGKPYYHRDVREVSVSMDLHDAERR